MYQIVDIIAHYRLARRIAHGGMAEIYLAYDIDTGKQVALKLVHHDDETYLRMRREVEVIASLQHEHILPIYEYGEDAGWCYLAMPYIASGTLNDRLARGPLSLEEAGMVLEQLASALQYAHNHGIIHRDIKPSNVLLHNRQHVYLADFGLVKQVGHGKSLTLSGYLIGTPDYMAPELADEEASPSSDIYALGVLLYQMLTGQVPFTGTTPISVFLKHLQEDPVPPSQLNSAIPPAVDGVILRAMAKKPQQRFASVSAFADMYQRALMDGQAVLADMATLDLVPLPIAPTTQIHKSRFPQQPRKAPRLVLAGMALLLGGLIVLGQMVSAGQQGQTMGKNDHNQVQQIPVSTPMATVAPPPTTTPTPPSTNNTGNNNPQTTAVSQPTTGSAAGKGNKEKENKGKPGNKKKEED